MKPINKTIILETSFYNEIIILDGIGVDYKLSSVNWLNSVNHVFELAHNAVYLK